MHWIVYYYLSTFNMTNFNILFHWVHLGPHFLQKSGSKLVALKAPWDIETSVQKAGSEISTLFRVHSYTSIPHLKQNSSICQSVVCSFTLLATKHTTSRGQESADIKIVLWLKTQVDQQELGAALLLRSSEERDQRPYNVQGKVPTGELTAHNLVLN